MQLLCICIIVYWLIIQIWYYVSLIHLLKVKHNFNNLPSNLQYKYRYFKRNDANLTLWSTLLHMFEAAVILPIKISALIMIAIFLTLFTSIATLYLKKLDKVHDCYDVRKYWIIKITKTVIRYVTLLECKLFGLHSHRVYRVINYDLSKIDGKNNSKLKLEICADDLSEQPCRTYVSNHVSAADILFMIYLIYPGFVSKSAIKNIPLIGNIAKSLDTVFVKRENKQSRIEAAKAIQHRQIQIWRSMHRNITIPGLSSKTIECINKIFDKIELSPTKSVKSLLVFPESTTSNGTTLFPFKTGAFRYFSLTSPIVLVYKHGLIRFSYEIIPMIYLLPLVTASITGAHLDVYLLPEQIPAIDEILNNDIESYTKRVHEYMNNVLKAVSNEPTVEYEESMQAPELKKECMIAVYKQPIEELYV